MNYSDYRFTLDVQIHQAQVSIPVTFGDTARRLCIGLTDGRKPYVIAEGCRAVFMAKKPDENSISNDCIIERNTIVYEFSENTTNAEGVVNCEIRLHDADDRVLTSPQFNIVVDKNVVRDEEIPLSESESTTLSRIISSEIGRVNAENARQEAEEARKETAEFLDKFGGVIVSEEEPTEEKAQVWVDSSLTTDEISLLDSTDIVQELSDAEDKVPSVALLKRVAEQGGGGGSADLEGLDEALDEILELQEQFKDGGATILEGIDTKFDEIDEDIDGRFAEVNEEMGNMLNKIYPVGSIYMSVNNTNPTSLFGGTWEQLKDRFLLGVGDTYSEGEGGNANHSHSAGDNMFAAISVGQVDNLTHIRYQEITGVTGHNRNKDVYAQTHTVRDDASWSTKGTAIGGTTAEASNIPPYLAVYMWKRIA